MTDWIVLLEDAASSVRLRAPASDDDVREAEARLGHSLPTEVASLLAQTDGCFDADAQYEPCWSLARLVAENLRIRREALMPKADRKLCFGDNGAGEPFFVHASNTSGWDPEVLVWSWIDSGAQTLAPSLDRFWRGWFDGTITS